MQTIALPDPNAVPRSLGFSPDGRLLAVWNCGRVYVIDTTAGAVRTVLGEDNGTAMFAVPGVGFTAAGHVVVAYLGFSGRKWLRLHGVDSGEVVRECSEPDFRGVEIGPGGRFIYFSVYRFGDPGTSITRWEPTSIAHWDPVTGGEQPWFGTNSDFTYQLAVSADERWVAGLAYRTIRTWSLGGKVLPSRAARKFKRKTGNAYSGITVSSDGAFVACNAPNVELINVSTGELWTVAQSGGARCRELSFHPARPVLAFSGASHEVALYDAAARTELKRYAWNVGQVFATTFSPDGLRCAAAGTGKVVIWDVDV